MSEGKVCAAKEKQRAWVREWGKANNAMIKESALRHRGTVIVRKHEHYQDAREERIAKSKAYYTNNKEKIKEKYKDYVPKPETRERKRLRMREKTRDLDDYYVQRIIRNNTGLPPHLQSKPLIEVQKLIIQIKRELRK
jgi:hypothetical protein